jgi:1-acyl-sn-glycerol-3-phosphate acyltransferase
MRRLPLTDQLPYQFYPPKVRPSWVWAGRFYMNHLLRRHNRVLAVDVSGIEHVASLLSRGDGVLIAPNHTDDADCQVIFELSRRVGRPFCYMAAYQIFTRRNHGILSRIGVFPVDREGADLAAFKAAVDVLARGPYPLVVFPEGETYHQSDRLTPLREGAAVVAATAAKKRGDSGRTVWVVPAGLKYRFLDGTDPLPALEALMTELEARYAWRPRPDRPLMERIYRYGEGTLGLLELDYLGATRTGPLPERLEALRAQILDEMEARRLGRQSREPAPVRVKDLRRACLEALADPSTSAEEASRLRLDLDDLFVVLQLFSYPGDYVRECPTLERVAETLTKLEEDALGNQGARPRGPRRALLKLGPPIDVGAHLTAVGGKLRKVGQSLTAELEGRMQGLLDDIGPGRPMPAPGTADSHRRGTPDPVLSRRDG